MTIPIMVIDDNLPFRQGVHTYLGMDPEFCVVGQASSGQDGVALVESLRPSVVVMDWVMPGIGGLKAARQLRRLHPEIHVIILSMHADQVYLIEALNAGVSGYILKEDTVAHLGKAIRAVNAGKKYFSPRLQKWAEQSLAGR
jgi:DNA-binding NarL/FixJ family response regulator